MKSSSSLWKKLNKDFNVELKQPSALNSFKRITNFVGVGERERENKAVVGTAHGGCGGGGGIRTLGFQIFFF
ncbi:hypothetical protein Pyn_10672 [Prunus yedoensis var. nudiflora]|uniref:Uncharacterized protein n=1 Tax=Prunus yedoensis var. nudiflora TaxID=2094558 RepID=A0A314XXW4_PRUYE|nr:hypothetical protein Pyn_10672 [Prunus yedoensis var. nudiflora]